MTAIRTLLVANRGEIACRVMRTATRMGIRTVAVYSDGDRGAPHTRMADAAVHLPGREATATYLDAAALVDAALRAGADAVHPGYGFLSERAHFAEAVAAAGLTWVGPPPAVIEAMGDKLRAKAVMAAAGVPVLPSWEPPDLDGVEYPVLVKAAAGGGGKGMRVVLAADQLPDALESARREAAGAFGDDTVFLERLVQPARHVEIQVLADGQGRTVHLFERECSIQRRHQKIIEECPSPAVDDELRLQMGEAAVAAARAVGYVNAGTVEFALEADGRFWFLEVNTRLQVEHPVTEAVTGIDIVRQQLRIASGLPLPFEQSDLSIDGHAVEARLYAEDPAAGYLPSTGRIVEWAPANEPPLRWETGVEAGSEVGIEFDPMLAKVIAHAPTRSEAAGALAAALERSAVRGVTTNRTLLVSVLRHPEFLAGSTTTDFLERTGLPATVEDAGEVRTAAAAVALWLEAGSAAAAGVLASVPRGWRNSVMPPEQLDLLRAGDVVEVRYRRQRDGRFDCSVDGQDVEVVADRVLVRPLAASGEVSFESGGFSLGWTALQEGSTVWMGDHRFEVQPRHPLPSTQVSAGSLLAPMPGKVVTVSAAVGEHVAAGTVLVVVEAMKMEHRVSAPRAGRVERVAVSVGDQVRAGDVLAVLSDESS